jgi:hypothetical protein
MEAMETSTLDEKNLWIIADAHVFIYFSAVLVAGYNNQCGK